MKAQKISIKKLKRNELYALSNFIVTENFNHHTNSDHFIDDNTIKDIQQEEERLFETSSVFVAKCDEDKIVGSIRITKWNYEDELSIEKLFEISPFRLMHKLKKSEAWHIGRFAIKSGMSQLYLFKRLITNAIAPACQNENSIVFAECDSKLLKVLRILGIEAITVGESINYLGSVTIPIAIPYEGLINFYKKNSNLLKKEQVKTGNKVKTDYTKV